MTPEENLRRLQHKATILRSCARAIWDDLTYEELVDLNDRMQAMEAEGEGDDLSLGPIADLPEQRIGQLIALGIMALTLQAETDAAYHGGN